MKAFELLNPTRLKIVKTTPHKEFAGEDRRQAISLRMRLEAANDVLVKLHPNLQDLLFWRPPELEAQQTAEGVPETKPFLRVPTLQQPVKIDLELTGYTVTIEHGIDDDSALELYDCTLSKFTAEGKEGGTAIVEWSVHSNKEITPELVGVLCDIEGSERPTTMKAPEPKKDVAPIDGTVGHPGAAKAKDDATGELFDGGEGADPGRVATDTFVEQHGGEAAGDGQAPAGDAAPEPEQRPPRTERGKAQTKAALAAGKAAHKAATKKKGAKS